jgi:hypothetical protein
MAPRHDSAQQASRSASPTPDEETEVLTFGLMISCVQIQTSTFQPFFDSVDELQSQVQ